MLLTRVLKVSLALALLQMVVSAARAEIDPDVGTPPVAKQIPRTTQIHGDTRVDNYFWLREKQNPEVIGYLEAENRYTAAVMKPAEGFQEALYAEMLGRIKQTDLSVPYQLGDWWYYTRTEKGKQYPIHCRRRGSSAGAEQVMLDLNEMAKGKKFLGLGAHVVSDDANLLAYSTDETGFREYRLHIRDLRTGKDLPDHFDAKVTSVAWAADNRTLFYVADDAAKRPYRLYRHVLGNPKDDLVYEEKDELYRLNCHRSRDKAYIFAASHSSITSECRFLPSDQPTAEFRVILPRENGHEYYVDHRKGILYVRTNKGAKNFRLVTAPIDDPSPGRWKEMIPHRKTVLLEGVDLFVRHCVVAEREEGLQRFHIYDLEGNKENVTDFSEPAYSVFAEQNPEFNTKLFRFRYQSLITPESIFDYDMDTHGRTLLKQMEVLGGYQPAQYRSERLFATASDGTRIPISLVYKSGVRQDGTAPMLLYGYGSYGFSVPITFQSQRLSFLDRGVVFAMAHIRGGSEMGRAWHDNGKMMSKRNTFTDFIAAADYLVEKKYASRERLAIQGGSAGGLLIGAVLNMRPDLCRAAVLMVPFVDVINTMLDPTLPLTVQEYLEWGNPNKREEYEYIKTYCPYTNLGPRSYPATLVMTSLNDSQVMYWEPAKYVAKMRTMRADKNPLLLKVRMAGGHGGASGRYDALRDAAFVASFVLNELGVTK